VPAIVWAPGRVPAGGTSDQLMTTMDILPTLAALAGAAPPKDRVIDGNDVSTVWHDEPGAASPTQTYSYYLWTYLQAVRSGKWKLHVPRLARPPWLGRLVLANHVAPEDYVEILRPLLFDLETDPGERNDLAAQHPEVVERLMRLVEKAREDLGDYDRSGSGQRFFDPRG
jgi:arylsulfatase